MSLLLYLLNQTAGDSNEWTGGAIASAAAPPTASEKDMVSKIARATAANNASSTTNVLSSDNTSTNISSNLKSRALKGGAVESGAIDHFERGIEILLYGAQKDERPTRHYNINKMLGAGYLDCRGMDPDLQKSLCEQVLESMDDGARAGIMPKLMKLADLRISDAPTVDSTPLHPSDNGPVEAESAVSFLFS